MNVTTYKNEKVLKVNENVLRKLFKIEIIFYEWHAKKL